MSINYASLLHFFNFMILGIFFKDKYFIAFILGILWEIFEYIIVTASFTRNILLKYFHESKYRKLWDENLDNKITDLIINMIGYYVGNNIKK